MVKSHFSDLPPLNEQMIKKSGLSGDPPPWLLLVGVLLCQEGEWRIGNLPHNRRCSSNDLCNPWFLFLLPLSLTAFSRSLPMPWFISVMLLYSEPCIDHFAVCSLPPLGSAIFSLWFANKLSYFVS